MTEEQQIRIDWGMVREWIGNNWFESDPDVSNTELDDMAIGIASEIDKYIKKAEIQKLYELQKLMTLFRDDLHGYGSFMRRNIDQSNEIFALRKAHISTVERIFDEIYKLIKKDFELVNMGNWDKSWIKDDILEIKKRFVEGAK